MCLFCGPSGRAPLQYRRDQPQPLTTTEMLAGPADIILHGGRILTMDAARPVATALSLRQGLVQSVGSLDEAMSRKGRTTRVIDLDGRVLLPGFVLAELAKNPVNVLDWQVLDGPTDDLISPEALSARGLMPSMFGEPVLVRIDDPGGNGSDHTLLLGALAKLCGNAPIVVALSGAAHGFVNEAMLRRHPDRLGCGQADGAGGFMPVPDLHALLRPMATAQQFSPAAVSRALAAQIQTAAAVGYTTLFDRQMGSIAGRYELDAATAILERSRRIRLKGAAHGLLRQEWDGKISPDVPPGRLSIDAAAVDLDEPTSRLVAEIPALHRTGWRMTFDARSPEQLDDLLPILGGLAPGPGLGRHRIETRFAPSLPTRDAIEALGVELVVEQEAKTIVEAAFISVPKRLAALTVDAARRRGLQDVAGMIAVGRAADFAVLDAMPVENTTLRVSATWLDGAPV